MSILIWVPYFVFSYQCHAKTFCLGCDREASIKARKMMQASFWKTKPSRTPRQFLAWRVFLILDLFLLSLCFQSSRLDRRFLPSGVLCISRFSKFILPLIPAFSSGSCYLWTDWRTAFLFNSDIPFRVAQSQTKRPDALYSPSSGCIFLSQFDLCMLDLLE